MASDDDPLLRLQCSRALLVVADKLSAEFSELPTATVYVAVGDARVTAARKLPDVSGYQSVLELEARTRLQLADAETGYELSTGTSCAESDQPWSLSAS